MCLQNMKNIMAQQNVAPNNCSKNKEYQENIINSATY